jgi:hypothetical protein
MLSNKTVLMSKGFMIGSIRGNFSGSNGIKMVNAKIDKREIGVVHFGSVNYRSNE